jgi:hypothetical protein
MGGWNKKNDKDFLKEPFLNEIELHGELNS